MSETTLSAAAISENLGTRLVGQNVLYFPVLTSTMAVAREEAAKKAPEGTVVIAGEQTLGRGRLKRAWVSPPGNLSLSLILYPPVRYLPYLVMVASLAVVQSIETFTGLKAQIKWPNDVLINGSKVCGILIENKMNGNKIDYVIMGIGVNVNLKVANYPEIASLATSLSDELGKPVSLLGMTRQLLIELEKLYLLLPTESIFQNWRDNLVTLGKRVRATWGDTVYEGLAESVAEDGSLLLRQPDGALTRIVAGDVTLRE
ncbi:MAG: biotin--[acetyl-CoA-carboxylase] ligase [Chloroflexi bacterium]|nr:biotin--[acetyl-CoA-carboxylase] ligase [Chloroflexota bacterium]